MYLKSVRCLLEKHPGAHKAAYPFLAAVETTLNKFGIKVPRVHQLGFFQLLEAYDRYGQSPYACEGLPHVLFFTPRFWTTHSIVENVIAAALSLKGVKCSFGICEGRLPICNIQNINQGLQMPCDDCTAGMNEIFQHSGFPKYPVCRYLNDFDRTEAVELTQEMSYDQLERYACDDLPLGQLVKISVRWFLAGNDIPSLPNGLTVYRNFLAGAIMVCRATQKLLEEVRPGIIFMLNGLFFEERIMHSIARKKSIPTVTYECGFIKNTFIFARNKTACHYDLSEHWPNFSRTPLTTEENDWIDRYLKDRQFGNRCTIQYWPKREERISEIRKHLNISQTRKTALLFTNIVWDSAVQEREIAFAGMFDWIDQTLAYFKRKAEYHLIIRVHPAEVRLTCRETRERTAEHIRRAFPELPSNISLVGAESDISSYRLIEMADVILVYTSTIGLEASLMGKPVIVSAETHYRGKGFTIAPITADEYFAQIDNCMRLDNDARVVDVEKARRYANLFFRRHTIDFSSLIEQRTFANTSIHFENMGQLKSFGSPELEVVCRFIVESANNTTPYALIQ